MNPKSRSRINIGQKLNDPEVQRMNVPKDLQEKGSGESEQSAAERPACPINEVIPDDLDLWVSKHEDRIRSAVCNCPEFETSPFCEKDGP